ncbi:MAG: GNAT family N-acetyltransferase [Flavobacteriaceae bacterium]|nr:GNAT family N-acetyltransferase [Flavobacteriaceae bacterium]
MNDNIEIRPIKQSDNKSISKIIKSALEEFNAAIEGTAYTDKETDDMFNAYTDDKSIYYVALLNDEIIAGSGINYLKDGNSDICELQKMYMSPKARGKKIGKRLIIKSLDFAKKAGYKQCYIETFPNMEAAIRLYKKNGFKKIDHALGNTCHYSCNVWMLKELY